MAGDPWIRNALEEILSKMRRAKYMIASEFLKMVWTYFELFGMGRCMYTMHKNIPREERIKGYGFNKGR